MVAHVDPKGCAGCGACVDECPFGALRMEGGHAVVDETACAGCHACVDVCPCGAIETVERATA